MTDWLESEGFDVIAVSDGQQAIQHVHDGIAVIVSDLKMPRTDGLELLRLAKQQAPHAAAILVSGYGTVETAVAALKEGAFDFLPKPINAEELTHRIRMALEKRGIASDIARLHAEFNERHGFENIIGNSAAIPETLVESELFRGWPALLQSAVVVLEAFSASRRSRSVPPPFLLVPRGDLRARFRSGQRLFLSNTGRVQWAAAPVEHSEESPQ